MKLSAKSEDLPTDQTAEVYEQQFGLKGIGLRTAQDVES